MHEIHLLKDLFKDLLADIQKNEVKQVTQVKVRLGQFTEINPEILGHFFKEQSKGTVLENAELVLETGEVRELRLVSYEGE